MVTELLNQAGSIAFVVVFFGLCIFVHELGHLLVALWRGLYIQRFSIGFGKVIWGTTYKGVEYVISILPFGGYVALPQLDPTDEPHSVDGEPLEHAPPSSRMLTAVAGPVANLIFGFFLALFIWKFGVSRPAPADYCEVTKVPETCAEYKAGLRPGDRIVKVNGKTFKRGWEELSNAIALTPGDVTLEVKRNAETQQVRYRPEPNPKAEGLGFPFFHVRSSIVVDYVQPESPAAEAGLQAKDRILRIDGEPMMDNQMFVAKIANSAGAPMTLVVERNDEEVELVLEARPENVEGKQVYRIGVGFGEYVMTYPNPWEQFMEVFIRTKNTIRSLVAKDSLVKPKHMSGPAGIALIIWVKVKLGGLREGLSFIILVTFSLAFFNLLPIPVLDGGHILFALVEVAIRRRVPTRIAYGLQTVFAVLLIGFMLYVTRHDLHRWGTVLKMFRAQETEETGSPAAPAEATPETAPAEEAPAGEPDTPPPAAVPEKGSAVEQSPPQAGEPSPPGSAED